MTLFLYRRITRPAFRSSTTDGADALAFGKRRSTLNGRPTGWRFSIDRRGNVLVLDTHYFRLLVYSPSGDFLLEKNLGRNAGERSGRVWARDRRAGGLDRQLVRFRVRRIRPHSEFSPEGKFIQQWGGHGTDPGQFMRPQHLELDADGLLWVADACNHRIQVFDATGKLVKNVWGTQGSEPGQMYYPYCFALDGKGHVYVCEYGNHRVQKFTLDGKSVGCWGSAGRKPGQLNTPWALVLDSRGRVHVLDSMNHRVQRFVM